MNLINSLLEQGLICACSFRRLLQLIVYSILITFVVFSHDALTHFVSESIHFIKVHVLASSHAIKLIKVIHTCSTLITNTINGVTLKKANKRNFAKIYSPKASDKKFTQVFHCQTFTLNV